MTKNEIIYNTTIAAQDPPILTLEKFEGTDQPFSNAQLAFIRREMTTFEASLVENVTSDTWEAVADIALSRPDEVFRTWGPIRLFS